MSRCKKGRSGSGNRYVALSHWMMRTEAWRDLDTVALCAYVELARRYGGPGSNNGRIPCSLREIADALNVSKATAMRALQRLQDCGFIVLMRAGAFNFKLRHATEWRLTEYSCYVTGELPTKNFSRWKKQSTVSPENPIGFPHETARVST